jgi:predicted alpha/beta-hydrolase family hydrolase
MKKQSSSNGVDEGGTSASNSQPVAIPIKDQQPVSGLHQTAAAARGCYVLAHAAGAGMRHPFLSDVAEGLAARSIDTLRYQFQYMERGSGRPDVPQVAHAAVRAAVERASSLSPHLPLFAGGKSFGGRMTSQAQAGQPLPGVRGLIFLGFPLHPPGKPSEERGKHLFEIQIPMLFLQGDRDEFADLHLLQSVTRQLGPRTTLKLFPDADHSFHVRARSGQKDSDVRAQMLDTIRDWIQSVLSPTEKKS